MTLAIILKTILTSDGLQSVSDMRISGSL